MKKVKVYKCFIASPGDTSNEREICDRVFNEINKTQGNDLGFRIESMKWENDSRPSFGESAQGVINEQLLDEFQLFIGIMFARFGTPTDVANSGTEEEFYLAYEKKDDVEIMFYFNNALVDPNLIDANQLSKVKEFKDLIFKSGGLYSNYNGSAEFERKLRVHLNKYFSEKEGRTEDKEERAEDSHELGDVLTLLEERLNDSLSTFSNQPAVWAAPILYEETKNNRHPQSNEQVEIKTCDIITNPSSMMIKAPPQFGLTCLSHYLVIEAWKKKSLWLYLDMNEINIHVDLESIIKRKLKSLKLEGGSIDCIILDSWRVSLTGSMKVLRGICSIYDKTPLIVMNTVGDFEINTESNIRISREFKKITLSALPRNSIRKVVSDYNATRNIGDEDVVLNKVLKDMEALNIHRTPLNCLTLLKISEKHFDENPVNRTKMIEMFLFVLFDLVELQTYRTKPDVKDCEYVLGYFCERMIKGGSYEFRKDEFIDKLNDLCSERLLDLEVVVVFDILLENRIIVDFYGKYRFKAAYWIYYFAAKQMKANKEFYRYIISNEKYTAFPEIIEFYTGIDRNGSDIIDILTKDLSRQCAVVENKTGLNGDFNLLDNLEWNPSEEHVREAKKKINNELSQSNLPNTLKDEYADKNYSYERPYNQDINDIFEKYTFLILKQKITASSRALRNSDYIEPEEKKLLLKEITRGWYLFSKILFILTPVMAKNNYASFDGIGFFVCGFNDDNFNQKIASIITANPGFVVTFFKDDLYSPKSAPLLYAAINSEKNKLIKHEMMLLLIYCRPKEWQKYVRSYIKQIPRNSVYLLDLLNLLSNRCKYDFVSNKESTDLGDLLKMCYAKHEYAGDKLVDQIKGISDKVIPKKESVL